MLTSADRRSQIQTKLAERQAPITANQFAKQFGVSRQTIVGDVALLRAQGEGIVATPQGYQYEQATAEEAIIVCQHTPEQTAHELQLIIEAGGTVKDVIIDHAVYGQLRGQLQIRTQADINLFVGKLRHNRAHLLSELTGGVHLHTIGFTTAAQLVAIKAALRKAGYLVE